MDKYTIPCTPEQTKKALELGAPIDYSSDNFDSDCTDNIGRLSNGLYAIIPTAEQMIGWLEEQDSIIDIELKTVTRGVWGYEVYGRFIPFKTSDSGYNSRKEATIAAIDAALDYLKMK